MEQDENAEKTLFFAEVFASDRDRLLSVKPSIEQSEEYGIFRSTTTNAKYQDPGCLYINLKIVFAGHHKQIRKLKFASLEGNITINMKDSQAEILELDSRLITGHSAVSAKVSKNAHIGGSVGSIRGDLVLGKEFTISMVQGPVVLNLAKAPSSIAMQGKVVVNQGNVTVGLVGGITWACEHHLCQTLFFLNKLNLALVFRRYHITRASTQSRQLQAILRCKISIQTAL